MQDRAIWPENAIADFKAIWPDAPVTTFDNAGHFIQEDVPQALVSLIHHFIKAINSPPHMACGAARFGDKGCRIKEAQMSAGPPILYVDDIHLTHGVTPLLDGASLSVGRDDRICLVGRNGSGKSTLLKIIAGQIEADSGERFVQPGIHVEYLAQDPDFKGFPKAEDFILQGLMNNEDRQRAFQLMADLHIDGAADIAPMSAGAAPCRLGQSHGLSAGSVALDEPTIILICRPLNG